jgi:hypothetical protein
MTIAHGDEKKYRILSPGPAAAFVISGAFRWESHSPLPLLSISCPSLRYLETAGGPNRASATNPVKNLA